MARITLHPGNVTARLNAEVNRLRNLNVPAFDSTRGIVVCGGGPYFPSAYVLVRMLRQHRCSLPIELWLRGPEEYHPRMKVALSGLNVSFRFASRHLPKERKIEGWQLKPFSILHSRFPHVLYLDADNVPLADPEFLFDSVYFKQCGAIFWPDFGHLQETDPIWAICEIPFRDEPEFESGQILLDKTRCWRELSLTMWFNWHNYFFYKYLLGDKDTFHMAFRKFGTAYAMPATPVKALERTMCQHDFDGQRLFQHRNMDKWTLEGPNRSIYDFQLEDDCKRYLSELKVFWITSDARGRKLKLGTPSLQTQSLAEKLINNLYIYRRLGFDEREMSFSSNGKIDAGSGAHERRWHLGERDGKVLLTILSDDAATCVLKLSRDGKWRGRWRAFERMPIELFRASERKSNDGPEKIANQVVKKCNFVMRAPFNSFTGYGLHSCEVGTAVIRNSIDVRFRATSLNETFAPLPYELRKRISAGELSTEWELLLHPPGVQPEGNRKTIYYTMWESTRLHPEFVRNLNQASHVLVPSAWNASCFSASGVDRPLTIVPLGIDTSTFRFRPMDMEGPCIFGAAGRLESGGVRKGLHHIIELFEKAFPSETDVSLRVKAFPDCAIDHVADNRVTLTKKYFDARELADWFAGITCFVSASKAEGWGLMQHQALATGRPLISTRFGGVSEFFSDAMGYVVDYKLLPGHGLYSHCGLWAVPDDDDLIESMRSVYRDRTTAQARGLFASQQLSHLSWDNAHRRLLDTLSEIGVIKDYSPSMYVPNRGTLQE